MTKDLQICGNCLFTECKKCNNLGSEYYDVEVAPNNTCDEWESKMNFN